MSRREEYLAREAEVRALADRIGDHLSQQTLKQAAESWRLLAELENEDPPTSWEARSFVPPRT